MAQQKTVWRRGNLVKDGLEKGDLEWDDLVGDGGWLEGCTPEHLAILASCLLDTPIARQPGLENLNLDDTDFDSLNLDDEAATPGMSDRLQRLYARRRLCPQNTHDDDRPELCFT